MGDLAAMFVIPSQDMGPWSPQQFGSPATGFNTPLSPMMEKRFQMWKQHFAPNDAGSDYDLRGAFLSHVFPSPVDGHWPDTFKKPTEPTFSNESIYARFAPQLAGSWIDNTWVPPAAAPPDVRDARSALLGEILAARMAR